jgi:UDP-N-acetylmuramoyl-L-alanyl-D-glutamate--2,6-diaminopimelate ligase
MNPKKIVRTILPKQGIKAAEETYRKSRNYALQVRYGFPARDLRVIAVTGTNGKTTTCMYINAMLKDCGYKTAMFTTAVVEVAGKSEINQRHTTVPLTADLLSFLNSAKQQQVDYVVLEVTSHALYQHKMLNIPIEVSVFTNLSQDHLDYHGTMEEYAAAKARLFNHYMNPNYCVLNRDDSRFGYYKKQSSGVVSSYGKQASSTLKISDITTVKNGMQFSAILRNKKVKAQTSLPGEFNVYNAAAAMAVGITLGIDLEKTAKGIGALKSVPGRMQRIKANKNFTVLIDYAVTPDALEKSLTAAKAIAKKGRVHLVFGATGDRDKSKRPEMGKVAALHADHIYLTDDETYTENPGRIRKMVMKGIVLANATDKATEIPDRKEAIQAALTAAKKDDVVLVTGIGHQDSRNMGGKLIPWNEEEIIKTLL